MELATPPLCWSGGSPPLLLAAATELDRDTHSLQSVVELLGQRQGWKEVSSRCCYWLKKPSKGPRSTHTAERLSSATAESILAASRSPGEKKAAQPLGERAPERCGASPHSWLGWDWADRGHQRRAFASCSGPDSCCGASGSAWQQRPQGA